MVDAVRLAAGDAQVAIAPATGGALASFSCGGIDILRPTPRGSTDVRAHACYPLVPYSNRIANAELAFAGRRYALVRNFGDHPHSIHGVGWQRPWSVAAQDAASVRLVLDHTAVGEDARAWPWSFRATETISLRADPSGTRLALKLTLANTGDTAFPFGLGFHPFFVRDPSARLALRARGVWKTDATRLPVILEPALAGGPFEPARNPGLETIDNVFAAWEGTATLSDSRRGVTTTLAADRAASFLVVYAPAGAAFLALEPVTHMTDAFNRAARGEQATGARTLGPGCAFSCTMEIGASPKP